MTADGENGAVDGGAHAPYPSFVVPSQLTLLLQPPGNRELLNDPEQINEQLVAQLPGVLDKHFGVKTHDKLLIGANGEARIPVVVKRDETGKPIIMQTVNLPGWMDEQAFVEHYAKPMDPVASAAAHEPGVTEVGQALRNFGSAPDIRPPDLVEVFWPVAASPNWLASTFCL